MIIRGADIPVEIRILAIAFADAKSFLASRKTKSCSGALTKLAGSAGICLTR
jgi:hypothetical protein